MAEGMETDMVMEVVVMDLIWVTVVAMEEATTVIQRGLTIRATDMEEVGTTAAIKINGVAVITVVAMDGEDTDTADTTNFFRHRSLRKF